MVALRALQKTYDLREPLDALLACDESAIDSDHQRHDCEPAGSGSDNTIIPGNIFASHSRVRIRSFPVVVKARFLQHRQQFIVTHFASAGRRRRGQRRLLVITVGRCHLVLRSHSRLAEKIRVTIRARQLDSDRLELFAVRRAINYVARQLRILDGVPLNFDVPVVTNRVDVFRSR